MYIADRLRSAMDRCGVHIRITLECSKRASERANQRTNAQASERKIEKNNTTTKHNQHT